MKNTVENFVPQGGKHCITNSLKQIFYVLRISDVRGVNVWAGLGIIFSLSESGSLP